MRYFHTSNIVVSEPDVYHSRKHLDFGMGFYLTPFEKQARDYGQRFIRRDEPAILNIFELSEEMTDVNRKIYPAYDGEWLDYVVACRKGLPHQQYDMIEGGIADDNVFDTVDLYLQEVYTREQALDQLRWKKPNNQLCIASQRIIDQYLRFVESITL